MKNRYLVLVILMTLTAPLWGQSAVIDKPLAVVTLNRTEMISTRRLDQDTEQLERQMGRSLTREEKEQVLETMVDQILILQAAQEARIEVPDEQVTETGMRLISQQLQQAGAIPPGAVITDPAQYAQLIEQQGLTVAQFNRNIRNQIILERYVAETRRQDFENLPPPTEAEIQEMYQRRINEFAKSDTIWFSHVFYDTKGLDSAGRQAKRSQAEGSATQIRQGTVTFEEIVRKDSEDQGSQARGGMVGAMEKGDPNPAQLFGQSFVDAVFALEPGQTSGVIESRAGYHIVKVTEFKTAHLLGLDDPVMEGLGVQQVTVRDYLVQIIMVGKQQQMFQTAIEEILAELRSRAEIRYYKENLS